MESLQEVQLSQQTKDEIVWYVQEQLEAQFREYVQDYVKVQIQNLIDVYRLKVAKRKKKDIIRVKTREQADAEGIGDLKKWDY